MRLSHAPMLCLAKEIIWQVAVCGEVPEEDEESGVTFPAFLDLLWSSFIQTLGVPTMHARPFLRPACREPVCSTHRLNGAADY